MQRPNNIGAFPYVDVANDVIVASRAGVLTNADLAAPWARFPDATNRTVQHSVTISDKLDVSLGAGNTTGFAVKIAAVEDINEYELYSVSGQFECSYDMNAGTGGGMLDVVPYIGRPTTAGNEVSTIGATMLLQKVAEQNTPAESAVVGQASVSVNTTLVSGPFYADADAAYDGLPVAFGFWVRNLSLTTIDLKDQIATLSIRRYTSDVPTFDPNV